MQQYEWVAKCASTGRGTLHIGYMGNIGSRVVDTHCAVWYKGKMTKPTRIEAYTQDILDLATALSRGETRQFINRDKKVLLKLRLTFYGFRAAVDREKAINLFPNLHHITCELSPTIGPEGSAWMLQFIHVDNTDVAKLLREQNINPTFQAPVPVTSNTPVEATPEKPLGLPENSEALFESMYGIKSRKPLS